METAKSRLSDATETGWKAILPQGTISPVMYSPPATARDSPAKPSGRLSDRRGSWAQPSPFQYSSHPLSRPSGPWNQPSTGRTGMPRALRLDPRRTLSSTGVPPPEASTSQGEATPPMKSYCLTLILPMLRAMLSVTAATVVSVSAIHVVQ